VVHSDGQCGAQSRRRRGDDHRHREHTYRRRSKCRRTARHEPRRYRLGSRRREELLQRQRAAAWRNHDGAGRRRVLGRCDDFAQRSRQQHDRFSTDAERRARRHADLEEGGPRINYIPRDGGNRFTFTGYANFSTSSLQSSNLTPAVIAAGLPTVDSLKTLWEVSPGVGGPIVKDKIWFYGSGRYTTSDRYVGGMWTNLNAMNPDPLVYEVFNPLKTERVINHDYIHDRELRITWQAKERLKLAAHAVVQDRCGCPAGITSTVSPEAANTYPFRISDFLFLDWSSPISSRMLVEGTLSLHTQRFGNEEMPQSVQRYGTPSMTDQATGITYGSRATYQNDWDSQPFYRFSLSYITGAHSFKAGMSHMLGYVSGIAYQFNPIGIRLN